MKKLKLMVVMGTRPEIIKLSEIIKKADKYFDLKYAFTIINVFIVISIVIIKVILRKKKTK